MYKKFVYKKWFRPSRLELSITLGSASDWNLIWNKKATPFNPTWLARLVGLLCNYDIMCENIYKKYGFIKNNPSWKLNFVTSVKWYRHHQGSSIISLKKRIAVNEAESHKRRNVIQVWVLSFYRQVMFFLWIEIKMCIFLVWFLVIYLLWVIMDRKRKVMLQFDRFSVKRITGNLTFAGCRFDGHFHPVLTFLKHF